MQLEGSEASTVRGDLHASLYQPLRAFDIYPLRLSCLGEEIACPRHLLSTWCCRSASAGQINCRRPKHLPVLFFEETHLLADHADCYPLWIIGGSQYNTD